MANLSNINNKFLVTTGGNVLIGQTSAVGSSILQVTGNSTFLGNVGIGISPNQNLHIFKSDATALIQASNTSGVAQLEFFPRDASNVAHKQSIKGVDSNLTFLTGGNSGNSYVPTERMRIDSSGNINIKTGTLSIGQSSENNISNTTGETWIGSNGLRYNSGSGTFARSSATAQAAMMILTTTADVEFYTQASTSATGTYALTPKMVIIGATGYVGIGTTDPGVFKLNVARGYSSTQGAAIFENGNSAIKNTYDTVIIAQSDVPCLSINETPSGAQATEQKLTFAVGDNNAVIGTTSTVTGGLWINVARSVSNPGYLTSGGINAVRILNNGNVGIGTTGPTSKLHIVSDEVVLGTVISDYRDLGVQLATSQETGNSGTGISFDHGALGAAIASARATTSNWGTDLRFYTHPDATTNQRNVTERMRIDSSGTVTIGGGGNNTSSSNNFIPVKINTPYSTTASPQWSLQGWVATTDGADPFAMTSGETTKNVYMGMIGAAYMNQNRFSIIQGGAERLTVNLTQTGGGGSPGFVGIGTSSPRAKLEVVGDITIQNGVYTYKAGGNTAGSIAINVDIPVGNEGGAGNVFKIEAGFAHYHGMTYNSIGEWWCTTRGTNSVNTYILNAGTAFAGTWSSSKPTTTTLRVTKSAGTYGGGGKWWVKVTYVPF